MMWLIFNDISEDIAIFNKNKEQWTALKLEAAGFSYTLVPL
jgi:hypothetical protein